MPTEQNQGGFLNSIARGTDQMQATLYSFADLMGEATGVDWLEKFGEEGVRRQMEEIMANPAQVESWDDIDSLADVGTWVIERIGEQVPNMGFDIALYMGAAALAAPTGGASVVGATAARSASTAALATLGKRVRRVAAAAGQRNFALGATGISASIQGAGETQMELAAEGASAPGTALFTGVLKGALDTVGIDTIMRTAKAARTTPGNLLDVATGAMKAAGKTMPVEGVTEGIQTVMDKVAVATQVEGYEAFSADNVQEILESAAAGAVVGGAASGSINAVQGGMDLARERRINTEANDAFAPAPVEEQPAPVEQPVAADAPQAPMFTPEAVSSMSDDELLAARTGVRSELDKFQPGEAQGLETDNGILGEEVARRDSAMPPPPPPIHSRPREPEEEKKDIIPDPAMDLEAQFSDLRNPDSTRRAVVVTPGADISKVNVGGLAPVRVQTTEAEEPYTIFFNRGDEKARELRGRKDPLTTQEIGELVTTPELAQNKGDGTAVQAVDEETGAVRAEVSVTQDAVPAAVADLEKQAPGASIQVTNVRDQLTRRIDLLEQEGNRKAAEKFRSVRESMNNLPPVARDKAFAELTTDELITDFMDQIHQVKLPAAESAASKLGDVSEEFNTAFDQQGVLAELRKQMGDISSIKGLTAENNTGDIDATDDISSPGDISNADIDNQPRPGDVEAQVRTARHAEHQPAQGFFTDDAAAQTAAAARNARAAERGETGVQYQAVREDRGSLDPRFFVEAVYAPDQTQPDLIVSRKGGAQMTEGEALDAALAKADAAGQTLRKVVHSEPRARNAFILAVPPGKKVAQPMAVMDLTLTGMESNNADKAADTVSDNEGLLAALTRTLANMTARGWDVSDAYDDKGRLKPSLIIKNNNISKDKNGKGDVTVNDVLGKGSERAKRNAAFQELTDAENEIAAIEVERDQAFAANNFDNYDDIKFRRDQAQERISRAREVVSNRFGYKAESRAATDIKQKETLMGEDKVDNLIPETEVRTKDTFDETVVGGVRDDGWISSLQQTPKQRNPKLAVRTRGESITPQMRKFAEGIFSEIGLAFPVTIVEGTRKSLKALQREQVAMAKYAKEKGLGYVPIISNADIDEMVTKFENKKLNGRFIPLGKSGVIVIRPRHDGDPKDDGARLWTLGHEIGHLVLEYARSAATPAQIERLKAAFEKDKAQMRKDHAKNNTPENPNWLKEGEAGFREWFADKVSARAAEKNKDAVKGGLADRFITETAKLMQKAWDAMRARMPKRFHANKTVNEVIDEWKSSYVFAKDVFIKPGERNEFNDISFNARPVEDFVHNQTVLRYGRALRDGFRELPKNKIAKAVFTVDGQLRAEFPELAKLLYQRTNETVGQQSFQGGVRATRDRWIGEIQSILKGYTDEQREGIFDQLAQEGPVTHPAAKRLQKLLDNYYDTYLRKYVGNLGPKVAGYFPRAYNQAAIDANPARFEEILTRGGHANARAVREAVTSSDLEYTAKTRESMFAGWQLARTINDRGTIRSLVDEGFLNASPEAGLIQYIEKTSRRAEFERLFGGEVTDRFGNVEWNPNAKLDEMIRGHVGNDAERAAKIYSLVSSSVFFRPVDTSSTLYNVIGELRAFESLRVLLGSGIASIPEVAAVFSRMKGEIGIKDFAKQVGKTIKDRKEAQELALAMGVVREQMSAAMMTEMFMHDGDTKKGFFRRALPSLFKWNGNDMVVNYTRILATGMGLQFIKQSAEKAAAGDARAKRYLAELGVRDHAVVARWLAAGGESNLWNSSMRGQEADDAQIVQDAVNRFVTESVLHPNQSERPTWADHPIGSLVFHLKTFAYSFSKNIIGGIYREMESRHAEGALANQSVKEMLEFAAPAILVFMVFGAISEEVRQRLFSFGERGGLGRANGDISEYAANITSRSGLFTLPFSEIVTGYGNAVDRTTYAAGPVIHHTYELMFGDDTAASKLVNMVPVLSQLPSLRQEIYDGMK